MKWSSRIIAIVLFLAVMAYGLSRFLDASAIRQVSADAERACAAQGGLEELEIRPDRTARIVCADGQPPVDSDTSPDETPTTQEPP